ncbi:MAG: hypothetical protein Q4B26_04785 [Eubacteriales bacterium]|nr:hypothetical protein [Eubacteriales bacterium]
MRRRGKTTKEHKKTWFEMTEQETNAFKRETCQKCEHATNTSQTVATLTCSYFEDEGHCRHCTPLECKEKGFYKPKVRKGQRKSRIALT